MVHLRSKTNSILEQCYKSKIEGNGEYYITELKASHDTLVLTVETMKIQLDALSTEIKETKVSYHLCLCGLIIFDVRSDTLS